MVRVQLANAVTNAKSWPTCSACSSPKVVVRSVHSVKAKPDNVQLLPRSTHIIVQQVHNDIFRVGLGVLVFLLGDGNVLVRDGSRFAGFALAQLQW